jgi:hypothetical protein
MNKLLWVTPSLPSGPLPDAAGHELASLRYRLLLPARALAGMGIASAILNPADAAAELPACDALVVGKLAHDKPEVVDALGRDILALVGAARARGVRTVADVCDDRFAHPVLGAYWRELVRRVDCVATGSDALAAIVRTHTAVPVSTIDDPVEGERGAPCFAPPPRRGWLARLTGAPPSALKLLWYGHQSNLDEVAAMLPALAAWARAQAAVDAVELDIVSAGGFGAEALAARHQDGPLRLRFTPWSLAARQQALRDCDMVIIPATLDSAEKRVKSANRLTEALWAGRHVLAHPVPSYLAFRDCAWISEDLIAGLGAALRHPAGVLRQLQAAQGLVESRCSPQAIARLWAGAAGGA